MFIRIRRTLIYFFAVLLLTGCNFPRVNIPRDTPPTHTAEINTSVFIPQTMTPTSLSTAEAIPAPDLGPTSTIESIFGAYPTPIAVAAELTIDYQRELDIPGSEITIENKTADRVNYTEYIASYLSEGNRIYGLLTIPIGEPPEGGFPAVVFNHGYIPPEDYRTTERYIDYVDFIAQSGFVVFKIDYRGHGQSEGDPNWGYFSPGYTIDAITALKSLQLVEFVDPDRIGMWGHSMGGNLVLRAMLVEPDIKAGVIWAGAVYSYDDFMQYSIGNPTYNPTEDDLAGGRQVDRSIFEVHGSPDTNLPYWQAVSLTENIEYLQRPLQIHHAEDDTMVNIGYSQDLVDVLLETGKDYEFYIYAGGGHNIADPYFDLAMQRTVDFFRQHLVGED